MLNLNSKVGDPEFITVDDIIKDNAALRALLMNARGAMVANLQKWAYKDEVIMLASVKEIDAALAKVE